MINTTLTIMNLDFFIFDRNFVFFNKNGINWTQKIAENNGSETKIIANYGNTVDTNDVDFYNPSIRIDTLIIN